MSCANTISDEKKLLMALHSRFSQGRFLRSDSEPGAIARSNRVPTRRNTYTITSTATSTSSPAATRSLACHATRIYNIIIATLLVQLLRETKAKFIVEATRIV
ncbi:hypothetical protein GQX74_012590 [Glossina fuscipes]|nr:hypothetical protein GQX74_012590 [Glossina fuscipes]